jgi:hypothetical protein
MMSNVCTPAFQTMISEIQKMNPDITGSFVFKENGVILAKDGFTVHDSAQKFIGSFNAIKEKSQTIGGLHALTIHSDYKEVSVTSANNHYLTMMYSKKADKRLVELLTKILVPSIVKLVDQLALKLTTEQEILPGDDNESLNYGTNEVYPDTQPGLQIQTNDQESIITNSKAQQPNIESTTKNFEKTVETLSLQDEFEQLDVEFNYKPNLPQLPENQLIVEKLGGLLPRPNTVRIDKELIDKWEDIFKNKKIEKIIVESLNKKTSCKFEPIKDPKYSDKGLIQIPEKIQNIIEVTTGGLVTIKPIISED